MSVTSVRFVAGREANESTLYNCLKNSASKIGYERMANLGFPNQASVNPALLFRPTSSEIPDLSCISWPESGRKLANEELVVFRFARDAQEELLSISVRMSISERLRPFGLEFVVKVPELVQYSERQRDALLRLKVFIEDLLEVGILEPLKGQRMTEVARRLMVDEGNTEQGPVPLEESRKRTTRAFFSWASSLASRGDLWIVIDSAQYPVLHLKTRNETQKFEVSRNLLNGSMLKRGSARIGAEPCGFGLEFKMLQECWQTHDGLEGIKADFGFPDATLGSFNPAGTGLSALEFVKDQWLYSGIVEDCGVVFREYADGRLAVNPLKPTT